MALGRWVFRYARAATHDGDTHMTGLKRLALAGAILLVSALAPSVVAQSKTAPPAALTGVPVFQADPKWPVLPADWTWGQVIGIFADSRGHVWTSSRSRISEWDPQGKLVQSWDARGPDGNWSTIHGMFVDHNGFVWTNARESNLTVKFTRTGQVALVIGKYNETGGSNDTTLMGVRRRSGSIPRTTKCSSPTATATAASSSSTARRVDICATGVRMASVRRIRRTRQAVRRWRRGARGCAAWRQERVRGCGGRRRRARCGRRGAVRRRRWTRRARWSGCAGAGGGRGAQDDGPPPRHRRSSSACRTASPDRATG